VSFPSNRKRYCVYTLIVLRGYSDQQCLFLEIEGYHSSEVLIK